MSTQGSSTGFLFTYHSAKPKKINVFIDYCFAALVDFGVPFSINFLSSSAFLGFQKALDQDLMSSSVSVVLRMENVETCARFDSVLA